MKNFDVQIGRRKKDLHAFISSLPSNVLKSAEFVMLLFAYCGSSASVDYFYNIANGVDMASSVNVGNVAISNSILCDINFDARMKPTSTTYIDLTNGAANIEIEANLRWFIARTVAVVSNYYGQTLSSMSDRKISDLYLIIEGAANEQNTKS